MRTRVILTLGTCLALLAGETMAVTRRVPEDYPTLVAALLVANGGDSVLVQPGIYHEHSLALPAGVVLVGLGEPGSAVIQGDGAHRLLSTGGEGGEVVGLRFRQGRASSGGALRVSQGSLRIESCLFDGNSADNAGGALELDGAGQCEVVSCTFADNRAPLGAAIRISPQQQPLISHCLIAMNLGGPAVDAPLSSRVPILRHCDIADNPGGDWTGILAGYLGILGNFCQPPEFCEPAAGDWFLAPGSPCLPEANPDGQAIGALGQGCAEPGLVARFSVVPGSGPAPLAVQFTSHSTGQPEVWEWDFEGNGVWVEGGPEPTHVYEAAGEHWPRLRISRAGWLQEAGSPHPVVVEFAVALQADSTYGMRPFTVTFTALPTGNPLEYEWDFGDGSTQVTTEPSVTHTYHHVWRRSVRVTARDAVNEAQALRESWILVYADQLRIPGDAANFNQGLDLIGPGTVVHLEPGEHRLPMGGFEVPAGVQFLATQPEAVTRFYETSMVSRGLLVLAQPGEVLVDNVDFRLEYGQTAIWLEDSASVRVRGSRFTSAPGPAAADGYVEAYGSTSVVMDSCVFHPTWNGLRVGDSARLLLRNSLFRVDDGEPDIAGVDVSCWGESRSQLVGCRFSHRLRLGGRSVRVDSCRVGAATDQVLVWMQADSADVARTVFSGCALEDEALVRLYDNTHTRFQECVWLDNEGGGGPMFLAHALARWSLEACLLTGNRQLPLVDDASTPPDSVTCCDVWGNSPGDWTGPLESFGGQFGNLGADPLLCDPHADPLAISGLSPCAPGNNSCGVAVGGLPVACTETWVSAAFQASRSEGVVPLAVSFQDLSQGHATTHQWDFESDGVWDSGEANPTHVYTEGGSWTVTLRVANSGFEDTEIQEGCVTVYTPSLLRVPEEFSSVAFALANATVADTVEVACGVYLEDGLVFPDGVVLRSATRLPDCVRIQGGGSRRLLQGSGLARGVHVEGITLAGGSQLGMGSSGLGGAVRFLESNARFVACVFTDNQASYGAVGHATVRDSLVLERCVLHGNHAANSHSAWVTSGGPLRLRRCLVTGQTGGILFSSTPTLDCCDLFGNASGDWILSWAGQLGQNGNLSQDPMFCDAAQGDFRLLPDSPCLPPASACGPMGAFAVSCETTLAPGVAPARFALGEATPNPFNPVARLDLQVPMAGPVRADLFNMAGQHMDTVFRGQLPAGTHALRVDGSRLASGVYLLQVEAGADRAVRKLILLK
jgi:PKD repeat protein